VITAGDGLSPPFIIDAPAFENGFDCDATNRQGPMLRIALDYRRQRLVYGS
jgi:hypothetical protein